MLVIPIHICVNGFRVVSVHQHNRTDSLNVTLLTFRESVRLCWCTETALISKICADAKRTLKVMAGIVRYSRQLFLLNSRMIRSLTHSFLGVKFSIFSDYLSMKLGYSVIFDVLKFLATIKNLLIIKLKNYQTQPTLTAKEHNLSKKKEIYFS